MLSLNCTAAAGIGLALLGSTAHAQMGMGMGRGQTYVVSVLAPSGNLAKIATTGVGVGIQSSFAREDATWASRMRFGIERFNGKKPVNSVQYYGSSFEVVHRSNRWYQFGGFSLASGRTTYDELAPSTGRRSAYGFDPGLTGGLGVQFGSPGDEVQSFLELGYVSVFRDGGNDTWVPLRFGIRF